MILSIYLLLAGFALALILIGYAAERPHAYAVGYITLFLLGVVLTGISVPTIGTGIDYNSGANKTITYTYTNSTLSATTETDNNTTTTYTNVSLGFFFAITSIWLFILTILQTGGIVVR